MLKPFHIFRLPGGEIVPVDVAVNDGMTGFAVQRAIDQALTEAQWLASKLAPYIEQGWVKIGEADKGPDCLPVGMPSREFRSCWRYDGAGVVVDPVLETAERWGRIRVERDRRLRASNGPMARANETGVKIAEWKAYRQALRDLPQTQNDPKAITWPTPPA